MAAPRHAVVLAGGLGTRLRPYTDGVPKPLVEVAPGVPILEVVLRQLAGFGFSRVTLAVGHLGTMIQDAMGDGSRLGVRVDYTVEDEPLGTMGPVVRVRDQLPEHFLVLNGDVLTDLDLGALLTGHAASGAPLTIATYGRQVATDFGVLELDGARVVGFQEKPILDYVVSMGVYALSQATVEGYQPGVRLGFDELVLDLLRREAWPRSHRHAGYWLDIGRPEDYQRARDEFDTTRRILLPHS